MGVFIIIPTLMFGILLAAVQGFVNYAHTSLVIRTNAQAQVMAAAQQASAPQAIYNPLATNPLASDNPTMVVCNSSTPPNTPGCGSYYTPPYQKLVKPAYSYQQQVLVSPSYSYQQTTLISPGYSYMALVQTSAGYYTTQAETGYTTQAYSYYVNTGHYGWIAHGGWVCHTWYDPSWGGYDASCTWDTNMGSYGWISGGYWTTGYRTVAYTYYVDVYHPPVYQWETIYSPPIYSTTTVNVPAVYSTQTVNVPAQYQTVPGFWTITGPAPWTTTSGFTIINAGTPNAAAVYTGTGSAANNQSATSPTFAVVPGATYTLQANINGTDVTSGSAGIELVSNGQAILSDLQTAGTDSTLTTTGAIPAGDTSAQVECLTNGAVVQNGGTFVCSNISVYESAPPTNSSMIINLPTAIASAQNTLDQMKYVTSSTCNGVQTNNTLQCVVNYTIPLELGGSVSGSTTVSASPSAA